MLAFSFVSLISVAQRQAVKLPADQQIANSEKSEWYGHSGLAVILPLAPGYEYAIRDTANVAPVGSQVTSVKFYNDHINYGYPSAQYNIKIYEGGSFDSETGMSDATAAGTEVYSQAYEATAAGMQEVTLTTPYTVSSGEYWVAIENAHASDTAGMFCGGVDATTNGQYVMLYNYSGTDYWLNLALNDGVHPATLSFYYDDGSAYEANSDLYAIFLDDDQAPHTQMTEASIDGEEDLVLYPGLGNEGPDSTSNSADIVLTIDGNEIMSENVDLATQGLQSGYFMFLSNPAAVTITAAEMDALSLEGTFDVCFTVTYNGVDNVAANNQACVTVDRTITGIKGGLSSSLSVYPNPAKSIVTFENAKGSTVAIFNMLGQEVARTDVQSNVHTINVSMLVEGSYLIRMTKGSEVITQKLNIIK